jgi:hypothetical protein
MNEWHIEKSTGWEIGFRAIVDSEGVTVCNPSPMGEANARLIAAAPDLLAALYLALPFVEDHEGEEIYKPGTVKKAIATIRAAIARAEGEAV